MYEALVSLLEFFDGLSDAQWYWTTGVFVVLFMTFGLDTDWKRRLFETHAEKMARSPKYRDKYLKRALRDKPWLLPGNKPWDPDKPWSNDK